MTSYKFIVDFNRLRFQILSDCCQFIKMQYRMTLLQYNQTIHSVNSDMPATARVLPARQCKYLAARVCGKEGRGLRDSETIQHLMPLCLVLESFDLHMHSCCNLSAHCLAASRLAQPCYYQASRRVCTESQATARVHNPIQHQTVSTTINCLLINCGQHRTLGLRQRPKGQGQDHTSEAEARRCMDYIAHVNGTYNFCSYVLRIIVICITYSQSRLLFIICNINVKNLSV